MKKLTVFKNFLLEDSGQTTTEYVLILAVIITILMQMKKRLLTIISNMLGKVDSESSSLSDDSSGQ